MRPLALLAIAAALIAVGAVAAEAKKTVRVGVSGNNFTPKRVSVKKGDSVVWSWKKSAAPHNVVAANGKFSSGRLTSTDSFRRTFTQKGTFVYYCELHGNKAGVGMATKVTVR